MSPLEWNALASGLGLSARQSQILHCAFYDERDSSIAARLGLSEHTVHTQRMRFFRRLGVTSMVQVVAIAASPWFELGAIADSDDRKALHTLSPTPHPFQSVRRTSSDRRQTAIDDSSHVAKGACSRFCRPTLAG
jgi:DNA-binding CsgD family transcriptional regulator